jgi:hypothetical protein
MQDEIVIRLTSNLRTVNLGTMWEFSSATLTEQSRTESQLQQLTEQSRTELDLIVSS